MIHTGCFCGRITLEVDNPADILELQVRCVGCPEDPVGPVDLYNEPATPIDGQLRLHDILSRLEDDTLWRDRLEARRAWWRRGDTDV